MPCTLSTLAGNEVLPLFSANEGGNRGITVTNLLAYILANITTSTSTSTDVVMQYSNPTSGETIIINNNTTMLIVSPDTDRSQLTIIFPANKTTGKIIRIMTYKDIGDLTLNGLDSSIIGCPEILSAFQPMSFMYDGLSWINI